MVESLRVKTNEINLLIESQKESEERYRSLVELSPEAVIVHQDTIIQYINSRGAKMFSASSPAVMIGRSVLDFIHPNSMPLVRSRLGTILSEQTTLPPTEVKYVDLHNNSLDTEATGTYIEFAGKPAILSVLRDISERKKTERALKENQKRLQSLIDNFLFGLLVYDWPSGKLQFINPRGLDMLGYTPSEVADLTAWDIYHASQHEVLRDRLQSKITGELSPEASRTYRMNKKNGASFIAEANGVLIDIEGQRVLQVVMTDVTERERLQEQLQMAQKMEAVGILAGGIAHDFNNILAAITGFSELALKDNAQGVPAPEKIEQILAAAGRARALVQQILTFSRRAEFEIKPVDLNEEIKKVISILERTIPKMISINLHLAPELLPCNGDHNQLQQVLLNLANNAGDAMPDGGQLTIRTSNLLLVKDQAALGHKVPPGEYVQLTVADTGQGMDKETLDHIFEPFYTTKDVGKGTGLGLASVYGIIEGHNGSIECLSRVGAGTTFRILLPALGKGIRPAEAAETDPGQIKSGSESILLVDDEESLRDLGQEIFSEFGYQTLTVSNGEEALEVYRQLRTRIDLVVLDINMPGMGGMKCLQELITLDPEVKVIIASGYSGDAQLKDMLDSGALAYLTKPFNMATMLKTVREVLDS
jgi:two-component system cell cycle sensor histidine kinase/response regulator CckA